MDIIGTYLQLAPEFGGTEFGPYEDLEVTLGADHTSCHIHIPADFGTFPIHAKLVRQSSTDIILTPSDQAAEIYLFRDGARRPEVIQGPTKLKNKDSFSLVTPKGPRFVLILKELPPELVKKREEARSFAVTGRKRLTAKSMKTEAKRQIWTQILVFGPMQILQRAITFVKSGAIFQPRNIFFGISMLGGYIIALSSCQSNKQLQTTVVKTETKLQSCQDDKRDMQSMKDGDFDKIFNIYTSIWGPDSETLARSLKDDKVLNEMVKKEARALFNSSRESWLVKGKNTHASHFKRWANAIYRMPDEQLDPMSKKVLLWAPTYEQRTSDYAVIENSTGDKTCALGILNLTYRQGFNLGIDVLPETHYVGSIEKLDDYKVRKDLIEQTLVEQGIVSDLEEESPLTDDDTFEFADTDRNGTRCLYTEGDSDVRQDQERALLSGLRRWIGTGASNLPSPGTDKAVISRVATLYLAEMPTTDFSQTTKDIDFDRNSVSRVLGSEGSEGEWVLEQTANALARSLVLPCLVTLDGDDEVKKAYFGEEEEPNPIFCFALNYKLNN